MRVDAVLFDGLHVLLLSVFHLWVCALLLVDIVGGRLAELLLSALANMVLSVSLHCCFIVCFVDSF